MEGILIGLVWLLIYALIVAIVCWIVVRILAMFSPQAPSYSWIVWAIGGLLLLILAIRLLGSVIQAHRNREAIVPSKTERQRRLMGADLERAREGKPTKTDMSQKDLKDFARKPPRSNPRGAKK